MLKDETITIKKKKKIPKQVIDASKFLTSIKEGNYKPKASDEHKIKEAKLILAVYGCQQEGLPVTISNIIIILGPDAASTIKILTPALYPNYGIIGP